MRKGGKGSLVRRMAMSAVQVVVIGACLLCAGQARAGDLRSEVMNGSFEKQLASLND